MENKQQRPTYPAPTRGPLRPDSKLPGRPKRSRRFMHDYEPATLLGFLAGAVILLGLIGMVVFYLNFRRSERDISHDAAVVVAKKLAEFNPAETADVMQMQIDDRFKTCTTLPQIVLNHYYQDAGQPVRTESTTIDLSNPDISSMLEQVVDRSDGAKRNELVVNCPI